MKRPIVPFAAVAWVVLWLPAFSLQRAAAAETQRFTQDRFVIGMWVSPATNEELDARYREIAEANFTLVVGRSGTNDQQHLERCQRFGLQTLIQADGPVEKLPDEPGLLGLPADG